MSSIRLVSLLLTLLAGNVVSAQDLRERLKDANGVQTEVWVYNDIPAAMAEARRTNKPLFVTFRCVPCKDCAAFDADVANGNERVRDLAKDKFISVRQVEMKNVDLSLFQFDHDLNWAAMFINADGMVYARYGTQSAEGPDAYNSIDGLVNTMNRVLDLHAGYPENRTELVGKRGNKPQTDALRMPGLKNPAKYAKETTRSNCIHCHNIHDAEHQHAFDNGTYTPTMLWKYPLPENLGLKIDRTSGTRIAEVQQGSTAEKAGLQSGEEIIRMNGQRIASIADMQWVLHHLEDKEVAVQIEGSQSGNHVLQLSAGWRKTDFSWRGSMWNAPPKLQVWLPELNASQLAELKLPPSGSALEARWINKESRGGQQTLADGLREKDVVIELNGQAFQMDSRQFNAHLKMNYKVGEKLPLTVLREGQKVELEITLVE